MSWRRRRLRLVCRVVAGCGRGPLCLPLRRVRGLPARGAALGRPSSGWWWARSSGAGVRVCGTSLNT